VFLSHASQDLEVARRVCAEIEASGWSVFMAARDLPGEIESADWSQRIDEALDASGALVLLASPEALTKRWVTYEWRSFHDDILSDRGGWIVPCCVRDIAPDELGRALRRYQIVDLRTGRDWQSGFSTLVSLIEGYLRRPIGQTPGLTTRRLLTIEGAGARTIIALAILERLEAALGGRLVDYFDLIVGSSAGAFVAARLAQGASVSECEKECTTVFERVLSRKSLVATMLFRSFYGTDRLRAVLADAFGDAGLSTAPACGISTYDLASGEHRLWSAHPALGGADHAPSLADVVAGSMASPVYFDPVEIEPAGGDRLSLVDGAIWAPDPTRVGLEAIRRMFAPMPLVGDIVLVSVGCGQLPPAPAEPGSPSVVTWAARLPAILMSAFRVSINEQVSGLYRDVGALEKYVRLDPILAADQKWQMDDMESATRFAAYAKAWADSRCDLIDQAAELLMGTATESK
jgi:predicted acylesterase/phospholipase RssA